VYVLAVLGSHMSFAILRLQKLKTFADVGGSLSHNYRNRETLNADADRTHLNDHDLDTNEKCMSAIRDRIPEKRRKDAVLCIEHLITASPEWDGWGTSKETEFFEQSKKWLENKYGKKNVVSTTVHRDETTPHLVAYVVPVDEETGRLNAKKYIGGSRHTLSQMQTDFAVEVKDLGLDRGVQGSKAKHTSIQEYYEKLNNYENEPGIEKGLTYEVPEPEFLESKKDYGARVANAMIDQIFDQIGPRFDRANTLASQTKKLKKELSDTKKTLAEVRKRAKPYLDIIDKYNHPNLEKEFKNQVFILEQNFDRKLEHHQFLKRLEEQERFNQQRELREQLRIEQEQKRQQADQEKREQQHLAFLRRQELEKQRGNEPKKPDNDNSNDYSPS
jgi:hypothetical protein